MTGAADRPAASFAARPMASAIQLVFLLLACVLTRFAAAQTSPYIPMDDQRLPLLEYLITRGDIEDPSPQVRPFRQIDAVRALAAADTTPNTPSGRIIRQLLAQFEDDTLAESRWSARVRLGGQAQNQKRRDQLRFGGDGSVNPYFDVDVKGVVGPVIWSVRPAIEPRLIGDPDWPNTMQENITARLIEGYVSAQWRWGELFYGQLDRNWGPTGIWGLVLSNYGYERQVAGIQIGRKKLRLLALGGDLSPAFDSAGGRVNRYLFAHRLDWQINRKLTLGMWETVLITGVGRGFDIWYRNIVAPSIITNGFGIRHQDETSNYVFGPDITWRPTRGLTLQGSLAIDDFWFNKRDQNRDRWGLTLAAYGPLGSRMAWRAIYSQTSSLFLRTFNPFEDYTDANIGIGRNFTDNDQSSVFVSIPMASRLIITPELSFVRQGEGRLTDPYPESQPTPGFTYPAFLVGTVEKTYRVGVSVVGARLGPLDLQGVAGVNHVTNAGNAPGVTVTRFLGAIQATLAWSRHGRLDL